MLLVVLFYLGSSVFSSDADHPDRVFNLPGAPAEPSFPLYSGFISVDIKDTQHKLFYVLCEAIRADPLEAPLVVWLNGGPGASSLVGFLLENGPYIVEAGSDKLRYNDFSWNQYYNVLYLETPSRVGFSRANITISFDNDVDTAILNTKALHNFMNKIHPRYASRDFFITGESYAGIYIPYLTLSVLYEIRDGSFTNDNFRGIAMGNPAIYFWSKSLSAAIQLYSMGMIPWKHGSQLLQQWEDNLDGRNNTATYLLHDEYYRDFKYLWDALGNETVYNLHLSCEDNESDEIWHIAKPIKGAECSQVQDIERYFNRKDVQEALHVIEHGDETFEWIAAKRKVQGSYYIGNSIPLYSPIVELAQNNFRILFYSGDLDMAVPAVDAARNTRVIARSSDMEMIDTAPKIWRYLGDFGGVQTSYKSTSKNITMDVLTVRGAGHLVPTNHPARSFQIINNFLSATATPIDYSAKIRRRKSLPHNSEDEFEGSGLIIQSTEFKK